jgi:HEPN domain-containing protein
MSKAKKIEDVRASLSVAEIHLKEHNYARAMYEAQRCIELSVKALLDKLDVEYKTKEGKIPHDVSDKIPAVFEKIKSYLENYDVEWYRVELARAAVLLRFLTSIREYLEYGVGDLASSTETFNSIFAEKLANTIVELVRDSHWEIYHLISKIENSQEKHS